MQHTMAASAHAVDTPIRVAVRVADGDGKAAIVSPDEVDDVVRLALHGERRPFARVGGEVLSPICGEKEVIVDEVDTGVLQRAWSFRTRR